jgi:uncharacterized protein (TIGR02001 family)
MDMGQDQLPLPNGESGPLLLAAETPDTFENAGFDRIGSLAALSANGEALAWLSEKNLTLPGQALPDSFAPSEEHKTGSKNEQLTSVSLLIEDWRQSEGASDARLAGLLDGLEVEDAGPSPLTFWSFAGADESGAGASGGEAKAAAPRPDGVGSGFSLTGSASLVSDYRFRGLSLSDGGFQPQGSLEIGHDSGFYAGAWSSGLKNGPSDVELDLYGGWRGKLGDVDFDLGAVYYLYPGAAGFNYFELLASAAYTIGPAELKAGIAYAPGQSNIGGSDNLYAFGEASVTIPDTPVTLTGHLGREAGSVAGPAGRKWDWSLGAEVVVDHFTLGLSYVDTNVDRLLDPGKIARPGVVASFKFEF